MSVTETTPQGPVPAIGIPDSQDYPRLIYAAPYFTQVPLAELIAPAVTEAVEAQLPSLVPPFVDQAAQDAVNQLAVLLAGSTMQGPLYLNPVMPTQPAQAASMAYVDSMIATAGIPEVPPTPIGQVWARMTGQWTPVSEEGGTFLPIGGGTMQGQINMSGNAIVNLPALPVMPNGAAPAQWVLQQIASTSLYQGTWNLDTYTPDLTQLSTHVNGWTWIAITTSPSGVVIGPPIPGLQGQTVFNGDTVIYSATAGAFQSIHSGGLTLAEANALYLSLNGGQLSGPLLLNANATQPTQAVTLQQLQTLVAGYVAPDAPTDGQGYLRVGATQGWTPGLPLTGGVTTGPILLAGNATNALAAVPYQQLVSYTAGNFLPLAGGSMTGLIQLSGNATAPLNPVTLTQLNSMLGSYLPLAGGTLTGNLNQNGGANTITTQGRLMVGQNANLAMPANANAGTEISYTSCSWGGVFLINGYPISTGVSQLPGTGTSSASPQGVTQLAAITNPLGGWQVICSPPQADGAPASGGTIAFLQDGHGNTTIPGVLWAGTLQVNGSNAFAMYDQTGGIPTINWAPDYYQIWNPGNHMYQWYGPNGNIAWLNGDSGEFQCTSNVVSYAWQSFSNNSFYITASSDGSNDPVINLAGGYYNRLVNAQGLRVWYGATDGLLMQLTWDGNLFTLGTVNGSDARLKKNIRPMTKGLEVVRQLVPRLFNRNVTWEKAPPAIERKEVDEIGFVAQEVQALLPEAVRGTNFERGGEKMLGIHETSFIAVLVNAVQELAARLEALEEKAA